jgi:putative membrane protein
VIRTAKDSILQPWSRNTLLQWLTACYGLIWLIGAIAPVNRFDWFLENLLVFVAIALLGWFFRARQLSDLSYILIALFLALHTVGAHYTYSKAPPGFWLQDALSLERNHYDRIIHFTFGLLIFYPVRETLVRHAGAGYGLSGFTACTVIATSSVVYEILEWIVAAIVSPEAAMAYLGTQGDVFDAQKDSTLAIAGAIAGFLLTQKHFSAPRAG